MQRTRDVRFPALIALAVGLGSVTVGTWVPPVAAQDSAATHGPAAFEILKQLEGRWTGTFGYEGAEETYPVTHEFRVSGQGTVVMESMFSGTEDEMISMYHLDDGNLVMTHYCAAGNQPRMKLDPEGASAKVLPFEFVGGSNLDPAKDGHLHSGKIALADDGTIESIWTRWVGGEQVGVIRLQLARETPTGNP